MCPATLRSQYPQSPAIEEAFFILIKAYDALGMDETFKPRFVRRYATLGQTIQDAIGHYVADVRSGGFPSDAESFTVAESKAAPGAIEPAPYSSAGSKNQ